MDNRPLGIIDSGIGGISVWQEIAAQLPHESLVYVADQARLPYGTKTSSQIHAFSQELVTFLTTQDVKAVVVACNTMTVHSLEILRSKFPDLPIIGTVPAIKKAVTLTKNKKIGVLSTIATARSPYQEYLIEEFADDCEVETVGTDALVPLVESLHMSPKVIAQTIREVVKPFQAIGCDTVVLGCTHYPFLREPLQKVLGKNICIIDSAEAIARQVDRILTKNNTKASLNHISKYDFYTTGDTKTFEQLLKSILTKEQITVSHIKNLVFPKK